jgi:ABC-type nitrate/sulfonate/bicarbonate transport system ATPase subunit
VLEPDLLLMDEPFSALDVLTAENLRTELMSVWQQEKLPTKGICIVTHNIEEAVQLVDRVLVLGANPGHIRAEVTVDLARSRDRKAARQSNDRHCATSATSTTRGHSWRSGSGPTPRPSSRVCSHSTGPVECCPLGRAPVCPRLSRVGSK